MTLEVSDPEQGVQASVEIRAASQRDAGLHVDVVSMEDTGTLVDAVDFDLEIPLDARLAIRRIEESDVVFRKPGDVFFSYVHPVGVRTGFYETLGAAVATGMPKISAMFAAASEGTTDVVSGDRGEAESDQPPADGPVKVEPEGQGMADAESDFFDGAPITGAGDDETPVRLREIRCRLIEAADRGERLETVRQILSEILGKIQIGLVEQEDPDAVWMERLSFVDGDGSEAIKFSSGGAIPVTQVDKTAPLVVDLMSKLNSAPEAIFVLAMVLFDRLNVHHGNSLGREEAELQDSIVAAFA